MYKKYENGLYGYPEIHKFKKFQGADNEKLFLENLKIKPTSWFYADYPISYSNNNHGHRCSLELDTIKKPYILFTGCSNTESQGVRVEDSFPYILSKSLNIDYYNLGLGGSGWDLLCYNLTVFLNLDIPKPKFIIIEWPGFYRYYEEKDNNTITLMLPKSANDKNFNFILNSEFIDSQLDRREKLLNLIKNQNIRYLEYTVQQHELEIVRRFSRLKIIDLGRDEIHPGINSHILWTNNIRKDLEQLNILCQ